MKDRAPHLSRVLFAALLAFAMLFALPALASANNGKKHQVEKYKLSMHVDLEGEYPGNTAHEHLTCPDGDYAVDGMWRVDHVDQENPQLDVFGDRRDVYADASYGDTGNPSLWHFRLRNNADGRAQVKLYITCLENKTEGAQSHDHDIQLSAAHHEGHGGVVPGQFPDTHNSTCPSGSIAVAPGYNFTSGYGKIFRSWPTSNFRGWQWAFLVNETANLDLYFRCLTIKTGQGGEGSHVHNLLYDWVPNYGGSNRHVPTSTRHDEVVSCGQHAKGIVGAFWIDDPHHVWYLGQDPRIKKRGFWFWHDGLGSNSVYVSLLCINDRTGKQLAP